MARERQVRVLAAALLVGAAACGRGTTRGGPDWLSASAKPVTLETTLDTAGAVAKVISAATGGTLSATGSDGTRYRLSIPGGALLSDETITLVPIASLKGLPLSGGSVAAVHIEPSGLQLLKAATLTIRAQREIPVGEQVAFAYYGGGSDAHHVPLSPDPRRVEMKLLHFSGYGFGQAAPGDPGRQALERASANEARLQSRMAQILDGERERQSKGEKASDLSAELGAAAVEYYDAVLRPLMQIAESDDRMAICCMQRYLGWERSLQLLGIVSDDVNAAAADAELQRRRTEGNASATKILANALEKGRERAVKSCREGHDLNAVTKLLSLERQMQLLGVSNEDDDGGAKAMAELRRCFSFDVEFDSDFDNRVPHAQLRHHVQAKVPVDLGADTPQEGAALATAPLEYVQYVSRMDEGITRAANGGYTWFSIFGFTHAEGLGTKPGTFTVHRIEWDQNPIEPAGTDCNGKDVPPTGTRSDSLTVTFQTGVPTDIWRATYRSAPPATFNDHTWNSMWSRHHEEQQVADAPSKDDPETSDPIYRMTLRPTEPGVWRAEFARPDAATTPGYILAEQGHLIVRHAPK